MEFIKANNFNFNENLIEEYSKKFNLHKDVVKLLFARNITEENEIKNFLTPPENLFFDPFLLGDMKEVVEKINNAIQQNKSILILGDYDTDGISASAILYKYFKSINVNVNVFLPNRLVDGYGLTCDTIDKVKSLYNPDLIITVDCGISCYNEIDYCKSLGVDIIVTDHHDIPEIVPNTLIINPKLSNQNYPFKELCGAGVAFKLVQALAGIETAKEYLTIASLATVADIVPLVSENRAIVFYGLKNQENMPIGLVQLIKKLKISLPISAQDIAYKLAPKINASGRMGDASISLKLYLEENKKEISNIIAELLEINDRRVAETNAIYEDTLQKLKDVNISQLGAIVLYSNEWESGVLGIICSKLVEKFNKPVCLLSLIENEYKGSCRSITGVNITAILNNIKHLLIRFGGHNQAGGLSVETKNIDAFCKAFNDEVLTNYSKYLTPENKTYDLEISQNVEKQFIDDLAKLEPFGLANEYPVFKVNLTNKLAQRMPNYPNHLKIKLFNLELLGFSLGDYYYNLNSNCKKELLIDLYKETYNKRTQLKGRIKALSFSQLINVKNKEFAFANYLKTCVASLENTKNINEIERKNAFNKVNELTQNNFGTLLVAYNFETYKLYLNNIKNIFNFELYNINDEKGLNSIIYAPETTKNFKNFTNVVYLDMPINVNYLHCLPNENIYVVKNYFPKKLLSSITTEYSVFGEYHNAIKNTILKGVSVYNMQEYYSKVKELNPQLSKPNYTQFAFVYMVLEELKIIEKVGEFKLKYNDGIHTKLTLSNVYNKVSDFIKKR